MLKNLHEYASKFYLENNFKVGFWQKLSGFHLHNLQFIYAFTQPLIVNSIAGSAHSVTSKHYQVNIDQEMTNSIEADTT